MWQPVLMICGYFISVLGGAMLLPAVVDVYYGGNIWPAFVNSAVIAVFIGVSLYLSNRGEIKDMSIRQAYLLTVLSWSSVALFSALPFAFYGLKPIDAIWEGFSGITTTGVSTFTNVEKLPQAILLWRSVLNGLGGVGIVIFATAMLPFLGIGGMQLFQRENSDVNEKFMPKISYMAKRIIIVYITLIALCFLSLHCAGMGWFEAICHAMSTISTSGTSTRDASIAAFSSAPIEWITILFMFLGACPLAFYYNLAATRRFGQLRSGQVGAFVKILLLYILVMWGYLHFSGIASGVEALRKAAFDVVSLASSTGYAADTYWRWGTFAATATVIFTLTGGCSGSTSGSVKIFRWQVIIAQMKRAMITITEPNRMVPLKIGKINVNSAVGHSVMVFFAAYFFSIVVLTSAVSLCGIEFENALGMVLSCITNVGSVIGSAGVKGYADYGNEIKIILSFAMLLGRLEVMTMLVLFTKNFWVK